MLGNCNYEKMPVGTLCKSIKRELTIGKKCKEAGKLLGLQWGGSWDGYKDFPACFYADDSRSKVYFNLSPNPTRKLNFDRYPSHKKYSAICTVPYQGKKNLVRILAGYL